MVAMIIEFVQLSKHGSAVDAEAVLEGSLERLSVLTLSQYSDIAGLTEKYEQVLAEFESHEVRVFNTVYDRRLARMYEKALGTRYALCGQTDARLTNRLERIGLDEMIEFAQLWEANRLRLKEASGGAETFDANGVDIQSAEGNCYAFMRTGVCKRENCRFLHPIEAVPSSPGTVHHWCALCYSTDKGHDTEGCTVFADSAKIIHTQVEACRAARGKAANKPKSKK
jgi:hypothetical protein